MTMPVPKNSSSVIPNTSAVEPRPDPRSSAIASKNAPNVYTVPNETPAPIALAVTTAQPSDESTWGPRSTADSMAARHELPVPLLWPGLACR